MNSNVAPEDRLLWNLDWKYLILLVDNLMCCYEKSNKLFKRKLNIISRIWGIRYILANYDYLFVNTEILKDMYVER
jgi:hypothetical protein